MKWTVGCSPWDTHWEMLVSNWPFPFLPPVELDTRCFKAIISVIVDKLRMDRCVPHHLPTQTSGWLRKTVLILGKPPPGFLASAWNTHSIPMALYPPRPCFLPTPCAGTSLEFGRHTLQTQPMLLEVPLEPATEHPYLLWHAPNIDLGEQEQVSVSRPSFPKAMLQRASHIRLALHLSSLLRKTKAGLGVPRKRGV